MPAESLTVDNQSLERFLEALERGEAGSDSRFIGRNFRLEERVPEERARSYREATDRPLAGIADWLEAHLDYSARALHVAQPPSGLPRRFDPADPSTCAESFRFDDAIEDISGTDVSLDLVRVERLTPIADAGEAPEEMTLDRFSKVAGGDLSHHEWVDAVLGRWSKTRDLRPAWATFWEDCADLLAADELDSNWARNLCNRLGLARLDPALRGRPVHVAVFRYPVRIVPTRRGATDQRALAYPTVLDGQLSEAFCPAPVESRWGRAVNLASEGGDPCRELIHPPVRLRAEHLWEIGTVDEHQPTMLAEARGLHLIWLQLALNRDDFGELTDADLLT